MQIIILKLFLVELLATVLVHNMSLVWNCKPPVVAHSTRFLVDVESLGCFHKNWLAILVVEISH